MRQWLALVLLGASACAPGETIGSARADLFPQLPKSGLQVITGSGTHTFQVWIAANDQSRARGLMNVRELPADRGMLFLFDRPQFAAFWMKDTHLSLDLVFIGADGVIVNVAKDATPFSVDPIPSAAPVTGVLELIAGTAARIGIVRGDRVLHPAFAPVQRP